MKTILVPVDFSVASENALKYAIELAKSMEARLILFHSYRVPMVSDTAPLIVTPDELEQSSNQLLIELDNKFKKEKAGIKTELLSKAGFAVDTILEVIEEKKPDLVVMGMKGHTNALDKLIGSNTTTIMKKTKCPVLVIPKDAKFERPFTFVLACDHKKAIAPSIVRTIKYYARLFDAKINILEIFKTEEAVTYENSVPAVLLEYTLTDYDHASHLREGDDAAEELDKYIATYKPEWLIMVPREHSGLNNLFHRSFTKQMAFHTHLPLLSIHE